MSLKYELDRNETDSLSTTKMAMYRALCAITSINCQLDVMSHGYWVNGHNKPTIWRLEEILMQNAPEHWNVMIPGRLRGIGRQDIYVGFFMFNGMQEPVSGERYTQVTYRTVARVVVVWSKEENVFTYDFDGFRQKPLFQFDELGSMR